mgnify:CR=1 FL=1
MVVPYTNGLRGGDSSDNSIQGQRYASGGAAQGGQFQVNTYTTSSQYLPAVSLAADGAFVEDEFVVRHGLSQHVARALE